jgi:hypothetical protein
LPAAPTPTEGNVDGEEAAETTAGPLKRLANFVAPAIPKPADESSKKAIRTELAKSSDEVAAHFLEQARQRYDDVFKRAENLERRAGTLQTSVVFAVTLTLTGGALLLDNAKIPSETWRKILAVAIVAVVALFAWAGLHASLAVARTEYWKVVGRYSLQARTFASLVDAQRHRTAAYLWCVNHNMAVNRWKGDELGRGLRSFLAGLAGLFVIATLVAVYAFTGRPV